MLGLILGDVPDDAHRRALKVCAMARVNLGEQAIHVVWHDWRREGRIGWLEKMETRGPDVGSHRAPPVIVALGEHEFAAAVRDALRDIARPDRLHHSPLLGSRLVRDRSGTDPVAQLLGVLEEARRALADDHRTAKARRALERTYFHGAVTQEAAAEVLHMAFSTYRRHLKTGVGLLVDQLWRWEIYGTPVSSN